MATGQPHNKTKTQTNQICQGYKNNQLNIKLRVHVIDPPKSLDPYVFECSFAKALWWNVCDRCDIPRMKKSLDEWIRWATVTWHGKRFVNFSRKLGFAATVYCIWQERNARIFADVSKASNSVFDQIECIISDKLVLMRNVQQTDENRRIQRLWKVNNMDS